MYTQCTGCATLFRVTARHLREAHGLVRCCLCHETFDALPSLTETLPVDLPTEERKPVVEQHPAPVFVPVAAEPAVAAPPPRAPAAAIKVQDASEAVSESAGPERDLFVDIEFAPTRPQPEERTAAAPQPPARRPAWGATLGWAIGVLLLVGLLMSQYAYFRRNELAQNPSLRPWLEGLCMVAGCDLPLLRDLAQIHILQRRVAGHPSVRDALLVKATLVNDASFPQPYPLLRLTFIDAGGRKVASRSFSPSDYLEDQGIRSSVASGMPPKQPIAVRLELADPGGGAAENFQIDFE